MLVSFAVILAGGWWVLRQVKMIPMALTFLATFSVLIGILALRGHSYWATWHEGPVGGSFYWLTIALSPEVLIFAFFMISDPQTSPKSRTGLVLYGATTALIAAGLVSLQDTEFGIKAAILASLLMGCALVPFFEFAAKRIDARRAGLPLEPWIPEHPVQMLRGALRKPMVVAIAVIAVAGVLNTALLANNSEIELIERNLTSEVVQ